MASWNRGKGKAIAWLRAHVDHDGEDCLIWPFSRDGHGHANLGYEGKVYHAARMICAMVHGDPPSPSHLTRHSCGNGHLGCVHPKHISWGTISENQLDRRLHGTHSNGGGGSRTKLPRETIAHIRASRGRISQINLAQKLGLNRGTIQYWQNRSHEPAPPGTSEATMYRRRKRQVAHTADQGELK